MSSQLFNICYVMQGRQAVDSQERETYHLGIEIITFIINLAIRDRQYLKGVLISSHNGSWITYDVI